MRWRLGTAALFAGLCAADAGAQSAAGHARISGHHVVRFGTTRAAADHARSSQAAASLRRCVAVEHMAGAVVIGDRAVELTMASGARWRLNFAKECPALSFYQGFYYRREQAGALCAGRDAVIARSGGECPIAAIVALKSLRHR